jgi:hypothetical protein
MTTTTDRERYIQTVATLGDDGQVMIAEDGAVEIVPTDIESVLAILNRLGSARREEF